MSPDGKMGPKRRREIGVFPFSGFFLYVSNLMAYIFLSGDIFSESDSLIPICSTIFIDIDTFRQLRW
jgi:hypothetical protein